MPGARAWWMLDLAGRERALDQGPRSYAEEKPAGMDTATDRVVAMLHDLQDALDVPEERLALGGFSQGSMAACNAAFTRGVAAKALVVLSGTPVHLEAWAKGMRGAASSGVFQSHGQQDPLLSFGAAERLRDTMIANGLSVTWVPFRGGHELPPPVIDGLGRFVTASFRPKGTSDGAP